MSAAPSLALIDARLGRLAATLESHPEKSVRAFEALEALAPLEREFLTLLFVAPFLQPIPVWGLSTILGALLGLMHGALALRGSRAPLPVRVARFELSAARLALLVRGARFLVRKLERIPSLQAGWAFRSRLQRRCASGGTALLGFFLALPLPIPFSNTIPAFGILLFSVAFLTENAVFLVLGYLAFVANLALFGGLLVLPWLGISFFR